MKKREEKRGSWSNHALFSCRAVCDLYSELPEIMRQMTHRVENQSSLESMDTPSKQRHCRLHSWHRESTVTTDKSNLAKILIQVREMFHEKLIQPLNRQPAACYITGILNCEYKHLFFKKSERWIVPWCTLTVCNKLQALQVFKKMI